MNSSTPLSAVLEMYVNGHPGMKRSTCIHYEVAQRLVDLYNGGGTRPIPTLCSDLSSDFVCGFLNWMLEHRKSSAATTNGKRQAILTLWRFARKRGLIDTLPEDVPKIKAPRRIPVATTPADFEKILQHCDAGMPRKACPSRELWTPDHWRALLLTLYDTGCRVGPLLEIPRRYYSAETRTLLIPGEFHKHGADTFHKLSEQTCALIDALPRADLLFPWPRQKRELWRYYRRICAAAGVPLDRRRMFHSIRRLSYSLVYREYGLQGATAHAAHAGDLSKSYLDPVVAGLRCGLDALPRPNLEGGAACR